MPRMFGPSIVPDLISTPARSEPQALGRTPKARSSTIETVIAYSNLGCGIGLGMGVAPSSGCWNAGRL